MSCMSEGSHRMMIIIFLVNSHDCCLRWNSYWSIAFHGILYPCYCMWFDNLLISNSGFVILALSSAAALAIVHTDNYVMKWSILTIANRGSCSSSIDTLPSAMEPSKTSSCEENQLLLSPSSAAGQHSFKRKNGQFLRDICFHILRWWDTL